MPKYHIAATITVGVDIEADTPQAAYQALRDGAGLAPNAYLALVDSVEVIFDEQNRDVTQEVTL